MSSHKKTNLTLRHNNTAYNREFSCVGSSLEVHKNYEQNC